MPDAAPPHDPGADGARPETEPAPACVPDDRPEWVRRFTPTELLYHWAQALPYLLLASTGSALLASRVTELTLSARELVTDVHLVTAILQVALPFLVALGGDTRILLANAREVLTWGRADLLWVARMHKRLLFPDTELPEAGKFNPGQKVNFLLVMAGIPGMAASGLFMYLYPDALLPWYVHVLLFSLLMPMLAVHLYMAVLNPATRHSLGGIFTGRVRREWAAHHHAAWLRSLLDADAATRSCLPPGREEQGARSDSRP